MASEADIALAQILSLVLERPVAPGETLRRETEPKWDSLKHLEIVMAVESAFGVSFSTEEMAELGGSEDLRRKVAAGA